MGQRTIDRNREKRIKKIKAWELKMGKHGKMNQEVDVLIVSMTV